jgi:hypothetical protein
MTEQSGTEQSEPEDAGCVDDTDSVEAADETGDEDEPETEHINVSGAS